VVVVAVVKIHVMTPFSLVTICTDLMLKAIECHYPLNTIGTERRSPSDRKCKLQFMATLEFLMAMTLKIAYDYFP
jgi:hypothetical protein